ncbi:lipase domain-containing protein [Cyclospora cayetanensis]|uniref:Lipase domain-containing protein n=1 Tax=Cyclospora cayetanensis TaxID=88456 RepID=A0A1D3CTN2_9EIME|nr:lipase domain-containing protein [Cyclospora cayetanensis]
MMQQLTSPCLFVASYLILICANCFQGSLGQVETHDYQFLRARAEAAKLLYEFAGENHVEMFLMDYTASAVPAVAIGKTRSDCSALMEAGAHTPTSSDLSPSLHPQTVKVPPVITLDPHGRPSPPCPKSILSKTPYYGSKGAQKEALPPTVTLKDVKQTADLTNLGLDVNYSKAAYDSLQVCNNFYFSSSGITRNSSDPVCIVCQLDESSSNIQGLDIESLREIHPRLRFALVLAANLAFTAKKKQWIMKLISSRSLRLVWHLVERFSEMHISMLDANVGEAINHIVLSELRLLQPVKDLIQFAPLRYDNLTPRFHVDPSAVPTAQEYATCPQHLTDLEFFDKVKAPKGRLTAQWGRMGMWDPTGFLEKKEPQCPVSSTVVQCPPLVNPDTCGSDATYLRPVETPWLFRLERDSNWVSWETEETQSDYVDRICASGVWHVQLWLLNTMWETVVDPELSPSKQARIHSGFLFLFKRAAKKIIDEDIEEVTEKINATGRRQVVLFTGHSLGSAVAQITAWYYAVKARALVQSRLLQIRCVTFGSPAWGNETAYEEFVASGVLAHDIATSVDPVTTLNGEPGLGHGLQWRKPYHYRIMLEDMKKVVVASANPVDPDFSGQLWIRKEFHPGNFLKRTFGALVNMNDVDSVFLNPMLTHFLSYTATLTIMADLVPEADYGSGLAAPLITEHLIKYSAHMVNSALIAAGPRMNLVLRLIALEAGTVSRQAGEAA